MKKFLLKECLGTTIVFILGSCLKILMKLVIIAGLRITLELTNMMTLLADLVVFWPCRVSCLGPRLNARLVNVRVTLMALLAESPLIMTILMLERARAWYDLRYVVSACVEPWVGMTRSISTSVFRWRVLRLGCRGR